MAISILAYVEQLKLSPNSSRYFKLSLRHNDKIQRRIVAVPKISPQILPGANSKRAISLPHIRTLPFVNIWALSTISKIMHCKFEKLVKS